MSRQQRRAAERAAFDRLHGKVLAGKTIRDLYLVYARERLAPHGIDINDEAVRMTIERAFYAGVAAMLELMDRVSPDNVSEEVGVEMLSRLYEELEAYTKRGRSDA